MALSDAQATEKIFQILGVPFSGTAHEIGAITTLYGSFGESYAFPETKTRITDAIAALTANEEALIDILLTRFTAIGSTSPMRIHRSASGAEGVIVDHPQELLNIRRELINLLGIKAPLGGFALERTGGGSISR